MGRIVTVNHNRIKENRESGKSWHIDDFFLLLYFCTINANRSGEGFDQYLGWFAFAGFISFFVLRMLFNSNDRYLYLGGFTIWYGVFYILTCASATWAIYGSAYVDIYTAYFLKILIFTFFLLWYIKDNVALNKVINMLYISFIYMAVMLIIVTPAEKWFTSRTGEDLYWSPCNIAFRFSIGIAIAFYLYNKTKKKIHLFLMIFFYVLSLSSGARQGVFMPIIIISIYLLYMSKNSTVFTRNVLIVIGSLIFIYILVMVVPFLYDFIGYRLAGFVNYMTDNGSWVDASTKERNQIVYYALRFFKAHPILGGGINNFSGYMLAINFVHTGAYTHNNFLEILCGLGIVGLVYYYSMIVYIIGRLLSFVKQKKAEIALFFSITLTFLIFDYIVVTYGDYMYLAIYAIAFKLIVLNKKAHKKRTWSTVFNKK